ncbi:hypothetical protein QYZ43_11120 [Vibrio parahaemolyticus]|nr:hypothetical protein [Vibrio parahaemolyticus]MDN4721307.1 hypothetical protein [Vibrio parahaemolyticus]MDN4729119.1 hypothetical protein [Vibrio parahaemolyticus]
MSFNIEIPIEDGVKTILAETGSSIMIVGANGSGKTRLAAYVEESMGETAHRIAAHRALSLNPSVNKTSQRQALMALKTGVDGDWASMDHRKGERWGIMHLYRCSMTLIFCYKYCLQSKQIEH